MWTWYFETFHHPSGSLGIFKKYKYLKKNEKDRKKECFKGYTYVRFAKVLSSMVSKPQRTKRHYLVLQFIK